MSLTTKLHRLAVTYPVPRAQSETYSSKWPPGWLFWPYCPPIRSLFIAVVDDPPPLNNLLPLQSVTDLYHLMNGTSPTGRS